MDVGKIENLDDDRQKIVENLPSSKTDSIRADSDLWEDDKKNLAEHNKQYSDLLEIYVDNTKRLLMFKYVKKHGIYNIAVWLFATTPIVTTIIIVYCLYLTANSNDVAVLNILPEILAAFGSLVATYIAVIKLITKYLFNKSEEKTMENIISKIQEYDTHIRGYKNED